MNRQITTFTVGGALLGLDILLVKEVYRHMELTPVPNAPEHMSGLMNLRGRVVTVVDLRACLNMGEQADENTILLIMKTESEIQQYVLEGTLEDISLGEDIVGFLINNMEEVLTIDDNDIVPVPPNLETVDRQLLEGVIKLDDRLVLLLDISALLDKILNLTKIENE